MRSVYVITMWSGGRPAKKWKSDEKPRLLNQGAGMEFVSMGTRLPVQLIGSISVEEFESGKEELEMGGFHHERRAPEPQAAPARCEPKKGKEPLF